MGVSRSRKLVFLLGEKDNSLVEVPSFPAESLTEDLLVSLAELLSDPAEPASEVPHLGEIVAPELNNPRMSTRYWRIFLILRLLTSSALVNISR